MSTVTKILVVKVRPMNLFSDIRPVSEIERASSPHPWLANDFKRVMRLANTVGLVAESGGVVVGFLVYEVHLSALWLRNLAVNPVCRRMGVGRELIKRVCKEAGAKKKLSVGGIVAECNLDAQVFLRDVFEPDPGFRWERTLPNYYHNDIGLATECKEDGYEFRWYVGKK